MTSGRVHASTRAGPAPHPSSLAVALACGRLRAGFTEREWTLVRCGGRPRVGAGDVRPGATHRGVDVPRAAISPLVLRRSHEPASVARPVLTFERAGLSPPRRHACAS